MKHFIESEPLRILLRGTLFSIEQIDFDKHGEQLFEVYPSRIYTKTEIMELLTEAMTWILKVREDDE